MCFVDNPFCPQVNTKTKKKEFFLGSHTEAFIACCKEKDSVKTERQLHFRSPVFSLAKVS